MIDKLETKYLVEGSPTRSIWDIENENKHMVGGSIKPKYISSKQDQTLFSRLDPQIPDSFETNVGPKLAIEEVKNKMKKHKEFKHTKNKYLQGKQYHEMNMFEKETYNLMHELRIAIKPETL
jgi:hypothetical protein